MSSCLVRLAVLNERALSRFPKSVTMGPSSQLGPLFFNDSFFRNQARMMDSFFSDFSTENNFPGKISEKSKGSWSLELSTGSVNPEDLKIAVDYENKNFEISGTEKVKKTLYDGSTLTSSQKFQRKFQLPENFEEKSLTARISDGVLRIDGKIEQDTKTEKRPETFEIPVTVK